MIDELAHYDHQSDVFSMHIITFQAVNLGTKVRCCWSAARRVPGSLLVVVVRSGQLLAGDFRKRAVAMTLADSWQRHAMSRAKVVFLKIRRTLMASTSFSSRNCVDARSKCRMLEKGA